MKILIMYTYNQGYLSKFFFELSSRLQSDGHQLINFSLKKDPKTFNKEGVSVIIRKKGGYLSNYIQIYKIIKAHKPDVILSNFSYDNPALLIGKLLGIKKRIVWAHSLQNQMMPTWSKFFIKRQFLKLVTSVIANSYLTKKELNTYYRVDLNKVKAVPFWTNITDLENISNGLRINPENNTLKIGCPGRFEIPKNQKILIQAASQLEKIEDLNFKIYFAGKGKLKQDLEDLINALNLNPKFEFVGHLSAEDILAFYKEMDIIVLPSLDEAFGLVFIEAIALGKPVVVSKTFGALSFIDPSKFDLQNFIFDPTSVDDLVRVLKKSMNNSNADNNFFKKVYDETFDKNVIYDQIKNELIN